MNTTEYILVLIIYSITAFLLGMLWERYCANKGDT